MEAKSKERFVHISPRKVRQVMALVHGEKVEDALNILHFLPKGAAKPIEMVIRSAVGNAMQSDRDVDVILEDLVIKKAYVDAGVTLKRIRPRARGMSTRIRKRSCHITVVISDKVDD